MLPMQMPISSRRILHKNCCWSGDVSIRLFSSQHHGRGNGFQEEGSEVGENHYLCSCYRLSHI